MTISYLQDAKQVSRNTTLTDLRVLQQGAANMKDGGFSKWILKETHTVSIKTHCGLDTDFILITQLFSVQVFSVCILANTVE